MYFFVTLFKYEVIQILTNRYFYVMIPVRTNRTSRNQNRRFDLTPGVKTL